MKRQPPQPVPLLMLTPEQACDAMQISRDQLEEWTHRAGFPVIRDGRVVRIPVDELRQWCGEQAYATNSRPVDPHPDSAAATSSALNQISPSLIDGRDALVSYFGVAPRVPK